MIFADINPKDPRWSIEQSTLLYRLFLKKEQYLQQGRTGEHHAMRQAIVIAVATFMDHTPIDTTSWGSLS